MITQQALQEQHLIYIIRSCMLGQKNRNMSVKIQ